MRWKAANPSWSPGRGKPIAEMVPRRPVHDLLPQLQALLEALPPQPSSGVDKIRALRDATER